MARLQHLRTRESGGGVGAARLVLSLNCGARCHRHFPAHEEPAVSWNTAAPPADTFQPRVGFSPSTITGPAAAAKLSQPTVAGLPLEHVAPTPRGPATTSARAHRVPGSTPATPHNRSYCRVGAPIQLTHEKQGAQRPILRRFTWFCVDTLVRACARAHLNFGLLSFTTGPPGCNLFVFRIPNHVTNQDLYELFSTVGTVISVRIIVDLRTGRSRGFGFVSYNNPRDAQNAIAVMHGLRVRCPPCGVCQHHGSNTWCCCGRAPWCSCFDRVSCGDVCVWQIGNKVLTVELKQAKRKNSGGSQSSSASEASASSSVSAPRSVAPASSPAPGPATTSMPVPVSTWTIPTLAPSPAATVTASMTGTPQPSFTPTFAPFQPQLPHGGPLHFAVPASSVPAAAPAGAPRAPHTYASVVAAPALPRPPQASAHTSAAPPELPHHAHSAPAHPQQPRSGNHPSAGMPGVHAGGAAGAGRAGRAGRAGGRPIGHSGFHVPAVPTVPAAAVRDGTWSMAQPAASLWGAPPAAGFLWGGATSGDNISVTSSPHSLSPTHDSHTDAASASAASAAAAAATAVVPPAVKDAIVCMPAAMPTGGADKARRVAGAAAVSTPPAGDAVSASAPAPVAATGAEVRAREEGSE